jgi:hypothetical protein
VISSEIEALSGSRFAVIIDEAHSSETGETPNTSSPCLPWEAWRVKLKRAASRRPEDHIIEEIKKRVSSPTWLLCLHCRPRIDAGDRGKA